MKNTLVGKCSHYKFLFSPLFLNMKPWFCTTRSSNSSGLTKLHSSCTGPLRWWANTEVCTTFRFTDFILNQNWSRKPEICLDYLRAACAPPHQSLHPSVQTWGQTPGMLHKQGMTLTCSGVQEMGISLSSFNQGCIYWHPAPPMSWVGDWTRWPLKVPSKPNYSVILWCPFPVAETKHFQISFCCPATNFLGSGRAVIIFK